MPSKPAGNSGSTQSVSSRVELPDWINQASSELLTSARDYANTLPRYQVAPITPGGQADIAALQGNVGSTNPAFATAQNAARGETTFQPDKVTPGWLSGTDLTPYMNPYTKSVIDATMPLIEQQRLQANNQTADLAAKTGAFGGSRHGVAEGVTNAQSGLYAGQLGAQLNQANFAQAQQAAQADLARSLAAQQANQQAGISGAGVRLGAAGELGNLASAGQTANLQGLMAALGGQTQLQQQGQAESDAPWQDAIRRLQIRESALTSAPYGQTSTQTGPGPVSNPWLTGLGALGTGAGIAGSIGSLFATGGVFSDRTMKTDIKKVGKDEETDLPIYSFRYKGDSKSYPKVVGIMAQDAQKKYPDQVVEIGGKLAVKGNFLAGIMERVNGDS
jgi:hypothetical protein